jgi:hypothetical protein
MFAFFFFFTICVFVLHPYHSPYGKLAQLLLIAKIFKIYYDWKMETMMKKPAQHNQLYQIGNSDFLYYIKIKRINVFLWGQIIV